MHVSLLPACTGLLLASGLATVAMSSPTTGSAPLTPEEACVAQYTDGDTDLGPGQARVASPNMQAVGDKGLSIKDVATSPDGRTGAAQVSMGDDADSEALGRAYAAQGRSVLKDAEAAGVNPGLIRKLCRNALANGELELSAATTGSGTIIGSFCANDNTDAVEWDGCVTRYRVDNDGDPNWVYGVDDAQAWGHETSCCIWNDLHKGGVKNNYNSNYLDVTQASPSSDIPDVDRCYNQTLGVSAAGFGLTSGSQICPDRWNISRTDNYGTPVYHKTQWEGETNDDREAGAVTAYRIRPGYSSQYSIVVNWDVH